LTIFLFITIFFLFLAIIFILDKTFVFAQHFNIRTNYLFIFDQQLEFCLANA